MSKADESRREFLKKAGLGAAGMALGGCAKAPLGETADDLGEEAPAPRAPVVGKKAKPRPNVVLIFTDDQGYGDLGCHGNTIIKTPETDRLHSESVRFTNFHVAPTCSPARAGLMTGRYCNRTGVWHTIMGRSILRRDEVTVADVFREGGYRTGIFGKWHLGDNYPSRPQDKGFDEVVVNGGGGVGQTPDYWGNDYFDDTYFHNGTPQKYEGYCTDVWFREAARFIEESKDGPFLCYIPTNAPHGPFLVDEKYEKMYAGNPKVPSAAFYGMITNIDENVGRLRAHLAKLGLEENTIFMFMTDNGTAAGFRKGKGHNAGMRGTKGSEYDGGHRVPWFVRWPAGGLGGGRGDGRDIARLTANVDVLPTLAELCGIEGPKCLEDVALDGASLVPLLEDAGPAWPDRTLVVDSQRIEHPRMWQKSAVMTQRWRLVNRDRLFDMAADPGQAKDVADAHPDVVKRLQREYEKWWASVSERFDEYCEIVVGSDRENPSRITCHDWHGPRVPWNQRSIRAGAGANGFWAVDVERAGTYEVSLRRWAEEADLPIASAGQKGKAIDPKTARVKIAGLDEAKPVPPGAHAVTFLVNLEAGKTRLETWFTDAKGASRGAYYVYVKRLA